MEHGKMDRYVRCEIPEQELEMVPGHGDRKDGKIFVHPEGVDLSKYPTRYGTVGQDTVPQARRYDPEPCLVLAEYLCAMKTNWEALAASPC